MPVCPVFTRAKIKSRSGLIPFWSRHSLMRFYENTIYIFSCQQRPRFFFKDILHAKHVLCHFCLGGKSTLSLHSPWFHDHKNGRRVVPVSGKYSFRKVEALAHQVFNISTCWFTYFQYYLHLQMLALQMNCQDLFQIATVPSSLLDNIPLLSSSMMVDLSHWWRTLTWCGIPLISTICRQIIALTYPL